MNTDLDKLLVDKYPELFKDRNAPMNETCMCWGFCCGDGWFNILNTLCGCIMEPLMQARSELSSARKYLGHNERWTAEAVTSAELKVEQETKNLPVIVQVKEKFGTLRFYVDNGDARVYALISFAEQMSAVTCEECGDTGKQRGGDWVRTLCSTHAKKE